MQHLKPKISQSLLKQVEQKSEQKSGIKEIICPEACSPIWQKAFALADNVRFTRTPDSEIMRRRAAIDPVYAKILAEAEALKSVYQKQCEEESETAAEAAGLPQTEPAAGLAAPAAIEAAGAAQNMAEAAGDSEIAPPEISLHEVNESDYHSAINQGYEKIEQMREEAEAAFGSAAFHGIPAEADLIMPAPEAIAQKPAFAAEDRPGPENAAAEFLAQEPVHTVYEEMHNAPLMPQRAEEAPQVEDRQIIAAPQAADKLQETAISLDIGLKAGQAEKTAAAAGNIFPWTVTEDNARPGGQPVRNLHNRQEAGAAAVYGAAAPAQPATARRVELSAPPREDCLVQRTAFSAAREAALQAAPQQMDIIRLFKGMECRQPQMRWIPVPAHIAENLTADWAASGQKAEKRPADASGFVRQANLPYPAGAYDFGQNKDNAQSAAFVTAPAAAIAPTLNLQLKLDGYNSAQDRFIWEHVQPSSAPALPQAREKGAAAANLDALCSSAIEKTGKPALADMQADAGNASAPAQSGIAAMQAEKAAAQNSRGARPNAPSQAQQSKMETKYSYRLPSLELLQEPVYHEGNIISQEVLERSAGLLESVLEDFGVKGEIIHVRPGPVVTLYEFEPAPGVKSSRVIGLSDDIARSMSSVAARVAVIPGRNVIGIELPNKKREMVYLREILQSNAYKTSDYKLPLALGKNIGGEPIIAELAKMPHLLVAGTTGSGKSVAINTMILSLIYRMTPQECRLIMVDPKMLELSVYDGIPHLLTPVVTDPKKALSALKWAVREMEDRYRKMAKLGVRNIDGFNARVKEALYHGETIMCTVQAGFDKETGELLYTEEAMDLKPLPYIVIIVDEMADLMMVAGKEIEGAIQRLAQMARAAGIHLIMATQRPSVDVITGTIKANFPTRISFQVTSKIDSRTILGEQGAEALLGQGDMLHMAGGGRLKRVHGPFVSDREVEKVVAHLKTQGTPEYLATVTESNEEEAQDSKSKAESDDEHSAVAELVAAASGNDDFDDLYIQAVKIVMRDKKCSTSYIQRRLGIGYNKAATLVEKMEEEGLVGEANHVGKREILINS